MTGMTGWAGSTWMRQDERGMTGEKKLWAHEMVDISQAISNSFFVCFNSGNDDPVAAPSPDDNAHGTRSLRYEQLSQMWTLGLGPSMSV